MLAVQALAVEAWIQVIEECSEGGSLRSQDDGEREMDDEEVACVIMHVRAGDGKH